MNYFYGSDGYLGESPYRFAPRPESINMKMKIRIPKKIKMNEKIKEPSSNILW